MALALPDPYADASDLAGYWRPLSAGETIRADTLLRWAAQLIREVPGSGNFDPTVCAAVSLDMVKRAMIGGSGITQVDQSMADITANVRYANPMGSLYLTAGETARLQGRTANGQAASMTLASNTRVPGEPWNWQPASQTDSDS